MPKFTPQREEKVQSKSPRSPMQIVSPVNNKNFSTPPYSGGKITKYSPKSASKAISRKKKFNFDSPKIKNLLQKINAKTQNSSNVGSPSNLLRLKRLILKKLKKEKSKNKDDKSNDMNDETCPSITDDSYYFSTTMGDSDCDLTEDDELTLDEYVIDGFDKEIGLTPKKQSNSFLSRSNSVNTNDKKKMSLPNFFKKNKSENTDNNNTKPLDIERQLDFEQMSVADKILGEWQEKQ
ncbi:hypothetical protein ABK040_012684 [Willaertia magna]